MRLTLRLDARPPPANDIRGKQSRHCRNDRSCNRALNRGDHCRAGHDDDETGCSERGQVATNPRELGKNQSDRAKRLADSDELEEGRGKVCLCPNAAAGMMSLLIPANRKSAASKP